MRRRAISAAVYPYITITVLVAPRRSTRPDLNTVIGNVKLWRAGLLAPRNGFLIIRVAAYVVRGRRLDQA
jgi:hypothetical protein